MPPDTAPAVEPSPNCECGAAIAFCASGFVIPLLLSAALGTRPAVALPSFAIQTNQPCATCHIGSFGPRLTREGRDFKLHGYVANDGKDHGLPLAFTTQTSFTHTAAPVDGGAAPGFKPNDNVAVEEVAAFYAGKITSNIGAFMGFKFDAVNQQVQADDIDIRHVREVELFGKDSLFGITVNNAPTSQDAWNSTPVWGFPFVASGLAPTPMASTLLDGALDQRVLGAGAYVLWNDLLYLEADAYKGLNSTMLKAFGQAIDDSDRTTTFMPYARLAVIRDWEKHHVEVGALALSGSVVPGGDQTLGLGLRKTDMAIDANYQYITDPTKVTSDALSAHAIYIHETARMNADDSASLGMFPEHSLDTVRADISYSFGATVTPTIQYFRTTGTADVAYWATSNGSPNSDGMIFEVAYVPWGKPDSPFPNVNLRLSVQYWNYFRFDGTSVNARNNNTFYVNLQTAVKF